MDVQFPDLAPGGVESVAPVFVEFEIFAFVLGHNIKPLRRKYQENSQLKFYYVPKIRMSGKSDIAGWKHCD